jgi:AAA family ATP:ADP antiporter
MQLTITGRVIPAIGVGRAAALLPLVFVIGFAALALSPVLLVVAGFQAVQRASNFGIANLARESLWTVVSRGEKFKAKNIVDGTVFRGADAVNAQIFNLFFRVFSFSIPVIAVISAVVAAAWVTLSLWLGKAQEARAREQGGG